MWVLIPVIAFPIYDATLSPFPGVVKSFFAFSSGGFSVLPFFS
jgi:hypothetical protein